MAIALHWAIAAMILVNVPLGLLHDWIEESFGYSAIWIHKSTGMTVLALSLARLGWRLAHPPPPPAATLAAWERAASRTVHWALYALMIALPVTGLIRSSAGPYPLTWFELFDVPKLPVEKGSPLAEAAASAHDWMGWAMAVLALLHIGAALRHRFLLGDEVLARMLPRLRPRPADGQAPVT